MAAALAAVLRTGFVLVECSGCNDDDDVGDATVVVVEAAAVEEAAAETLAAGTGDVDEVISLEPEWPSGLMALAGGNGVGVGGDVRGDGDERCAVTMVVWWSCCWWS